jgi:hypothetical protein
MLLVAAARQKLSLLEVLPEAAGHEEEPQAMTMLVVMWLEARKFQIPPKFLQNARSAAWKEKSTTYRPMSTVA